MKIIDLFCGIGGLSLGFEQAGFEVVSAIDMWADAVKTYNHNRKEKVAKVITVEDFNNTMLHEVIKEHHITGIIGGPPCQGFSTVGRRNIDDPRNKMYLEFYKSVKIANPDFFVIENVKGMLTLNKGAFVKDLLERFGPNGLGYTISYQLVNAADYGIPQNRYRVFYVGIKNKKFEQATMGVYAYDKNVIPYLDNSSGNSINNTLKFDSGIYVTQIIKNGPASKTELKEGDIIVAIDDKELETMNDLREYIYSKNPNDIVTLQIARGKINKTISIVLRKKIKISEWKNIHKMLQFTVHKIRNFLDFLLIY